MRSIFLFAILTVTVWALPANAASAYDAEVAQRVTELIKAGDCISLGRAITLVAAQQVLRIYDQTIPDRDPLLAEVTNTLKKHCPDIVPAFPDPLASLGSRTSVRIPISGGGGGSVKRVPVLILAYSHMNSEERTAFLKALPSETETDLTSWINENRDVFTAVSTVSTETLKIERKIKLDEDVRTMWKLREKDEKTIDIDIDVSPTLSPPSP